MANYLQGLLQIAMQTCRIVSIDGLGPQQCALPINTGTVTAPGAGTAVTVAATGITKTSMVVLTPATPGGTQAGYNITSITPGTGFQVTFGSSDTTIYNWVSIG
jgi:hypothetical protein